MLVLLVLLVLLALLVLLVLFNRLFFRGGGKSYHRHQPIFGPAVVLAL